MAVTITIASSPVLFLEDSFKISRKIGEARRCQFTVLDYAGTQSFPYGARVLVTDAVLGVRFAGVVIGDKLDKSNVYPDPTIEHQLDCTDNTRLAAKRTSNRQYLVPTPAGKIAADMVSDVLAAEGVLAQYAGRFDTTQADFARGTLSSTTAGVIGDGDLELSSSGGIASASYMSQADWATGTGSAVQLNADGTVSLVGVARNWNDGLASGQTLYGNGSPSGSVSGGTYRLSCTKQNETRSRMDFAGTWGDCSVETDVAIGADVPKTGLTWRTTGWGNADGGFGYALEFTSTQIEFRKGTNSSGGGSTSSLGVYTFSPKLAYGTYRLRVDVSGSGFIAYVNGTARLGGSDTSYSAAGYLALRNRNGDTVTVTDTFDNFGVVSARTGTWTSPSVSVGAVTTVQTSAISWDESLSGGGTIAVSTSIDGGSTYQPATNGNPISGLGHGASGTGKSVLVQVALATTNTSMLPVIRNLQWSVVGGYAASGSRTTLPLAMDYMNRANQSGGGTASDGQTYTKTGTGTDAIASNLLTITNTTGDVYEKLGTLSAGDSEGQTCFLVSAATITAGVVLRYVDSNNWFALLATTTTLSLVRKAAGTQTTLAQVSSLLAIGARYRLRLRVVGTGPAALSGKLWPDGTPEPAAWSLTGSS